VQVTATIVIIEIIAVKITELELFVLRRLYIPSQG